MAVLERSDLEASPLADLHAIADQLGLDGFRRLRKESLIDAILGEPESAQASAASAAAATDAEEEDEDSDRPDTAGRSRRRRPARSRRAGSSTGAEPQDGERGGSSADAGAHRDGRRRGARQRLCLPARRPARALR